MPSYNFTKTISLSIAFDKYLSDSVPYYDGMSYSEGNVTVYTTQELTEGELLSLTNLVDSYTDPAYFLSLSRTVPHVLHTHWTSEHDNTYINGQAIMETFIYPNRNSDTEVLDAFKTIFEYNTSNVQNFLNTTTGTVNFSVVDISRNVTIVNDSFNIPIEVVSEWNSLAQSGSTQGSTIFKSRCYSGLMNVPPDYDCVWQFRGSVNDSSLFDFRVNSYQELYYNKYLPE